MTPVNSKDGQDLPELPISRKTAGPGRQPTVLQLISRTDALPGRPYQPRPGRTGLLDARALHSGRDGWEHCIRPGAPLGGVATSHEFFLSSLRNELAPPLPPPGGPGGPLSFLYLLPPFFFFFFFLTSLIFFPFTTCTTHSQSQPAHGSFGGRGGGTFTGVALAGGILIGHGTRG